MAARRVLPFVALALAAAAQDSTAFTSAKIVPDVIASFEPTVSVQLTFDHEGFKIPVTEGVLLTINQTATEPVIALKSSSSLEGKAYLVAMVDPDAPTPQNKSVSQVRHWLAPNFVAGAAGSDGLFTLTESGAPVGKYAGPGPAAPSDPHRYTVLVYEQPSAQIDAPSGNANAPFLKFDVTKYTSSIAGLKLVGGTYFRVGPLGTVPTNGTNVPTESGEDGTETTTSDGEEPTATQDGTGAAVGVKAFGASFVGVVGVLAAFALV
ncbi:PEBP-like protein [Exidia glandulosa HHB12029]|uniref:PEBP-like protein n=1 Tax=Exidia glandulosa HHB12029 TaxID=1314781 RepID=A0A165EQ80_EXIGL|nr:PEBP-like protein [Exidia glandulosa HHB12029]